MRRRRGYETIGVAHIGVLLAEAIGDADRVQRALGVWPAWEQAVGPQIARAARPVGLRRGVLTVHVRHAVWMQELVAMRETLLRRIRKVASAGVVRELRFKVAPLPPASTEWRSPTPATGRSGPIPYELARTIRSISSPSLRATLVRVASRWSGTCGR